MKTFTLLATAVALAIAGPVLAGPDAALPKELPPYAPDGAIPVPRIEKKTLANGLEIWVVPRRGLPRVDAVLAVRNAGLAADAARSPGFASMLADLLSEGTQQHDSREIAELAQGLGGSIDANATLDGIVVSGNALASRAPQMLELLGEVSRQPTFPDEEVRLAQANALQALKAAEAQPGFKAERALARAIYGDHPYARTQPTETAITGVTPQALRDAHAKRFRPDQALLVVTGPVSASEVFGTAEAAFGSWQAPADAPLEIASAPAETAPKYVIIERPGSVQSTIRLGRPAIAATHADYVPLQLAGTVLGGGFSSRLMQNLREDKGYTYGARGGLGALREGGRLSASADVRNEVTGAALKEFMNEFRRMGEEPVPAQELDDTKRYVAGGYLLSNQMQAAVAATLANNWLIGLPAEFLGEYVPKIRGVDAAQVQAMGRKYLDPKQQSIVVVGDSGAVAEQLEPYGTFETPTQ